MYPFGPPQPDPDRMPTEPEQVEEPEVEDDIDVMLGDPLIRWRAEQFAAMDFTPHQARALALRRTVDVHWVRNALIGRGCDRDIAFDIAS